ncbi:hypothetical protein WAK64_20555 [Bacillus spongiae]|uniref:Uncharacterized protein n=1 Tax=Bacillus spongiae TaxID=2683610 RepID=A0ABU8HJ48_9BACI
MTLEHPTVTQMRKKGYPSGYEEGDKEEKQPYFTNKNGMTFEPTHSILQDLYKHIEKYNSVLGGSRFYDDLIDIYETIDFDLKEDKNERAEEE